MALPYPPGYDLEKIARRVLKSFKFTPAETKAIDGALQELANLQPRWDAAQEKTLKQRLDTLTARYQNRDPMVTAEDLAVAADAVAQASARAKIVDTIINRDRVEALAKIRPAALRAFGLVRDAIEPTLARRLEIERELDELLGEAGELEFLSSRAARTREEIRDTEAAIQRGEHSRALDVLVRWGLHSGALPPPNLPAE